MHYTWKNNYLQESKYSEQRQGQKHPFHLLLSLCWGWNLSGIQELRNPSVMLVPSCVAIKFNSQELNSNLLTKPYKDCGRPVREKENHRNTEAHWKSFPFFRGPGSLPSGTGNLCAPCLNPSLFSSDRGTPYSNVCRTEYSLTSDWKLY